MVGRQHIVVPWDFDKTIHYHEHAYQGMYFLLHQFFTHLFPEVKWKKSLKKHFQSWTLCTVSKNKIWCILLGEDGFHGAKKTKKQAKHFFIQENINQRKSISLYDRVQ